MTAMTVTRRNIIDSAESGDRFVEGVVLLDQEMSGLTTAELNNILSPQVPGFRILGINQEVSVWDLFVLWHFLAMRMSSAPPRPLRNLAHGGPVFLPWHRTFLIRLEEELQRVTADAQTALPYWDWAADGELPADEQRRRRCGTFSVRRRATWSPGRWRRCRSGWPGSRCSCGPLTHGH